IPAKDIDKINQDDAIIYHDTQQDQEACQGICIEKGIPGNGQEEK
ncbi:unnamed protein product, partial [marine sediment metagenome]